MWIQKDSKQQLSAGTSWKRYFLVCSWTYLFFQQVCEVLRYVLAGFSFVHSYGFERNLCNEKNPTIISSWTFPRLVDWTWQTYTWVELFCKARTRTPGKANTRHAGKTSLMFRVSGVQVVNDKFLLRRAVQDPFLSWKFSISRLLVTSHLRAVTLPGKRPSSLWLFVSLHNFPKRRILCTRRRGRGRRIFPPGKIFGHPGHSNSKRLQASVKAVQNQFGTQENCFLFL